jgi:hypothetical protein
MAKAIRKELKQTIGRKLKRHVKTKTTRTSLIGCKLIFKTKSNGVYSARIAANGIE